MPSVLRSLAVLSFVSAIAVVSAPGCSQQGEGERCDSAKNGDADCDDGLVCVGRNELVEGVTDRCCPSDANDFKDSRCTRGTPSNGSAGTSSGGSGGTSSGGEAGGSIGGAAGAGAAAGEAAGGSSSTVGGSPSSDGGMSQVGGMPTTTDGGVAGASIDGQGGAG